MLCALYQTLYHSYKAIAALVVCVCLLNAASLCSAQSMNALPVAELSASSEAIHSMHRDSPLGSSEHDSADHHHSSRDMPCCDDQNTPLNELAAQLCCEPVDGIVPEADKPLFSVVYVNQTRHPLWSLSEYPRLVLQPLTSPPAIDSFPARHLTLGVQLI